MIKALALLLLGWKRTPERFVSKFGEYIPIYLREQGIDPADRLTKACRVSLSQLAYLRAAKMDPDQQPRFRNYVHELDVVAKVVAGALAGHDIDDERIRSILLLHRAI